MFSDAHCNGLLLMLRDQEWAKQTGRYREGVDTEDYPTWKTRLRCALRKAPDIEELVAMRNMDSADPYRVYHFKSPLTIPGIIIWCFIILDFTEKYTVGCSGRGSRGL